MLRLPLALRVAVRTRCADAGPLPCLLAGSQTTRNGFAEARWRRASVPQTCPRRWVLTDAAESKVPENGKSRPSPIPGKSGKNAPSSLKAAGLGFGKNKKPKAAHATVDVVPKQSGPEAAAAPPIHDLNYLQQTMRLPKHEDYPLAPKELFVPNLIAGGIYSLCGKLQLSLQTDVGYQKTPLTRQTRRAFTGKDTIFVCELKVNIGDFVVESATGEGLSKQIAKQTAYYSLLTSLHSTGKLDQLYAELDPTQQESESLVSTKVNTDTSKAKRDSKMDIYNYAAALGQTPIFEIEPLQLRKRKGQGRRLRVKISLADGRISASAIGTSLLAAEIAAATLFKEEAERQQASNPDESAPTSILSSENAQSFVESYKTMRNLSSVEVEHESIDVAGATQHIAKLSIDGRSVGLQTAYMPSKKASVTVAYLTAAIEISHADPDALSEFEKLRQKGKGQALHEVSAIDIDVDHDILRVMRDGLLEARSAGLPDLKEDLQAEEFAHRSGPSRYRQRLLSQVDAEQKSNKLLSQQRAFEENPALGAMRATKAALPINHHRAGVNRMIQDNVYSIVIGATGSGKTTQVPQILLEEAISAGKGGLCNVICTQPRRIAATSVAKRVADERNEPLQESIGYQVRFDARLPEVGGSITYCTTGILLEQLKHDPDGVCDSVSHIIIDEVHERDLNIDFLMVVLKSTVRARQAAGRPIPRIVLMSATLDPELFARYLAMPDQDGTMVPCPSISVPGRTFPVKEQYLGDIIHDLAQAEGNVVNAICDGDKKLREYLKGETEFSRLYSGRNVSKPIIDWKRQHTRDEQEDEATRERQEAYVPTPLLAATIGRICSTTPDGAILAFLPGLEEIMQTEKLLMSMRPFGVNFADTSKYQICLLHSTVPKEQQANIFKPSPPGCRKIILSTNIAETSVTVADVKHVVDTGKMRESRYDQARRITKLQCVWVSKSNSKQRAGRAGRVQNGNYYALFSQERHQSLQAVGLPELLRTDLSETALSVKANFPMQTVGSFLAQAIQPPTEQAVDTAVADLKAIEAFTMEEELTDLGRVLDKLPVHPSLGKMIILGVIFRCLDPMLAFGAAAAERSLFVAPPGRKAEARAAHRTYTHEQSDHLAFFEAFKELRALYNEFGTDAAYRRANEQYLHMGAFRSIDQTARQIESLLVESSLIGQAQPHFSNRLQNHQYGPLALNSNSDNPALIKCLLIAGLHPNLSVKATSRGVAYRTAHEYGVLLHPSSVNYNADAPKKASDPHEKGTIFTFSTLARSTDGNTLYARGTSLVTPLMAALFGGRLVLSEGNRLNVDDWLPFFVKSDDQRFAAKMILEFKKAMERMLNGAFRSLQDLKNVRGSGGGGLADDPVREGLARRVVQVLDSASGRRMPRRMATRIRR